MEYFYGIYNERYYIPFFRSSQQIQIDSLITAVNDGNLADAEILLYDGADPNIQDKIGNSLLQLASLKDNTEMVSLLLDYKADPNLDRYDQNSLFTAINNNNTDIVRLLLEHYANPNRKNGLSMTPLQQAILIRNLDIIELLLQYEADPLIQDSLGANSYDFADLDDIIALMESYEEVPNMAW